MTDFGKEIREEHKQWMLRNVIRNNEPFLLFPLCFKTYEQIREEKEAGIVERLRKDLDKKTTGEIDMRNKDVKRYLTIINNIKLSLEDMVNNLPIQKNDVSQAMGFTEMLEKELIREWLDDWNDDE